MSDSPASREQQLRFLCFGMGAIGTYIGGSLALAGFPVSFIERPESISRVKGCELTLDLQAGKKTTDNFHVYPSLEEALKKGSYDVALAAVKSFDTQALANQIKKYEENFPTLLCLQNGVENEAVYESVLGKERVIGASITTAVGKSGLGNITVEKMRGIGIESTNPLSNKLINAFNLAGMNAVGYSHRSDMKWSKMITNLLGNANSAILNWSAKQVFSDPAVYQIEVRQIRETLAVMEALGIKVVNLPGTPIKILIALINSLPLWASRPISSLTLGKGRGEKMPSFHIDLYAGQTRSEVTYLNGAVVRFGQKLGIPTPVNQVLTSTLEELAAGKLDKQKFSGNPQKLISIIQEKA